MHSGIIKLMAIRKTIAMGWGNMCEVLKGSGEFSCNVAIFVTCMIFGDMFFANATIQYHYRSEHINS